GVQRDAALPVVMREIDHQPHPVLAACRDMECGRAHRGQLISEHFTRNSSARPKPRPEAPYARPVTLPFARAAIGSTNPAKVAAVREALATLAPDCAVEALEVPSGVGHQPFGDAATRAGALERARKALAASDADIAFGLEGGVELDGPRVWLLSWVAAIDPTGREGYASGLRMLLPASLAPGLR